MLRALASPGSAYLWVLVGWGSVYLLAARAWASTLVGPEWASRLEAPASPWLRVSRWLRERALQLPAVPPRL